MANHPIPAPDCLSPGHDHIWSLTWQGPWAALRESMTHMNDLLFERHASATYVNRQRVHAVLKILFPYM